MSIVYNSVVTAAVSISGDVVLVDTITMSTAFNAVTLWGTDTVFPDTKTFVVTLGSHAIIGNVPETIAVDTKSFVSIPQDFTLNLALPWKTAGTSATTGAGWTGIANTAVSDNTYAVGTTAGWYVAGDTLKLSNFSFSVPTGSVVTGLYVRMEGYYSSTNGVTPNFGPSPVLAKDVASFSSSANWATIGTYISTTENATSAYFSATSVSTNGAALSTWTSAEFNAASCGLVIQAPSTVDNPTTGGAVTTYLDEVDIRLLTQYLLPSIQVITTKSFTSTFNAVTVINPSFVSASTATFTSTFNSVNINAIENISISTKTFTSTQPMLYVMNNFPQFVGINTKTFIQTFINVEIKEPIPVATKVFTATFALDVTTLDTTYIHTKVFTLSPNLVTIYEDPTKVTPQIIIWGLG